MSSDSWEEAKELVKARADIVDIIREHVDLKRSGFRYLGLCPFHHEKTPSFTVHPDQQFYHCFGCKASGDVFSFMMEFHHLDFPESLKVLAQRYQVELPEKSRSPRQREQDERRKQMYALNDKAADLYHRYLLEDRGAEAARRYLQRRNIPESVQQRYRLGYAPAVQRGGWNFLSAQLSEAERQLAVELGLQVVREKSSGYDRFRDRIMCPIYDSRGRVCGFGGRILGDGEPKYLNSPESPIYSKSRLLFGLYQQREAIRKQRRAVLVEGNFDLLALVARGFELGVAPLGTALTREQLRLLKPLADEIVLLFDGDQAGLKAAERSVPLFLAEQLSGLVALLPPPHDPDTFVTQFGIEPLAELIERAGPLPEFALAQLVDRYGETLDGKFKIIEELRSLVAAAPSPVQRDAMAKHFGDRLNFDPERLLAEVIPADSRSSAEARAGRSNVPLRKADLTGALKFIITFMVRHPRYFSRLLEHRVDDVLAGTVGETICIQLKALHEQGRDSIEPEELFSELPRGEERALVASLLTEASDSSPMLRDDPVQQLEDILNWLDRERMKKRSEILMRGIKAAEMSGDFAKLNELMQEKMEVDKDLKQVGIGGLRL
jgi:DNA primase